MQIISGAQQGIDIVARALLKHGDIVFVESPTYPGAMAAFRSCGAKIIDIKLTKEGIDLADLENKLKLFKTASYICDAKCAKSYRDFL